VVITRLQASVSKSHRARDILRKRTMKEGAYIDKMTGCLRFMSPDKQHDKKRNLLDMLRETKVCWQKNLGLYSYMFQALKGG
jgi:hypothetical protein